MQADHVLSVPQIQEGLFCGTRFCLYSTGISEAQECVDPKEV